MTYAVDKSLGTIRGTLNYGPVRVAVCIDEIREALAGEEICTDTLGQVDSGGGWSRWGTGLGWCHAVTMVALLVGGMDGMVYTWPKYR